MYKNMHITTRFTSFSFNFFLYIFSILYFNFIYLFEFFTCFVFHHWIIDYGNRIFSIPVLKFFLKPWNLTIQV